MVNEWGLKAFKSFIRYKFVMNRKRVKILKSIFEVNNSQILDIRTKEQIEKNKIK